MTIDREELWYANKALEEDLNKFCDIINSYKDAKLVGLILKYYYPGKKYLSDFSPNYRDSVIEFFEKDYITIKSIVDEYY